MSREPASAPAEVAAGIAAMRQRAQARYGAALVEVHPEPGGLRGSVALPQQAEELAQLLATAWPSGRLRVLILSRRRPRLVLVPQARPLDVLRRPPEGARAQELTTQLLPGDPPLAVLARRGPAYLVRAPGEALGWVAREGPFRVQRPGKAWIEGSPAPGWDASAVLSTALGLLGRPYVFGGTGAPGVDCSGLTWRAFLAGGVVLPRNSRAQRRSGERVPLAELRAADLVCAVHRSPRRTSHVALALSGEEVVHACSECHEVRREPLAQFLERYQVLSVRRLPGALPQPR